MINSHRVLITGAQGMLGSYAAECIRTDRSTLDVENLDSIRAAFEAYRPEAVLHLAARTDLVACQRQPNEAYRTNAAGTYNVALAARERGLPLVYISTSAVFDGMKPEPYTESDEPNPQSHYAHSKYLGELAVARLLPEQHLIARTCWLFGGGPHKDHKFVANILRQLDKPKIQVIGGKRGSPTYGKDLMQTLLGALDQGMRGVVHVGNEGAPARVEIAREIVHITNSTAEVVEVDASVFETQYPGAGARGNESITSERLHLRPWQDALEEYIKTEWQS